MSSLARVMAVEKLWVRKTGLVYEATVHIQAEPAMSLFDAHELGHRVQHAIRDAVPGVAIRTTCIVGFPGETEEDFQKTLKLIRDVNFDQSFSFVYSRRPGTPAAGRPDRHPGVAHGDGDPPLVDRHDFVPVSADGMRIRRRLVARRRLLQSDVVEIPGEKAAAHVPLCETEGRIAGRDV